MSEALASALGYTMSRPSLHLSMSDPTFTNLPPKKDFIRQTIRQEVARGLHNAIRTRFPPEPNGFLHIGHAKAICLNFGIAEEFGGTCTLRLDDTNPSREDPVYAQAIQEDVRWLGFHWESLRHASDYFEVFYQAAQKLISDGKAYVCDLTSDAVRQYRGTLTTPGQPSPWRNRSIAENSALFERMRAGEFADGSRTLRAKIDMASGNINLRDPTLYRIKHVAHQNTGNQWPIYPMYDFAHSLSDAIEGITHSLCTLEFEDHRPLYDWCIDQVDLAHQPGLLKAIQALMENHNASKPTQIEFSRLNINYTVLSKRKLTALVEEKLVDGWDDPRLPTLQGLRRRGYTPSSIRAFAECVGISKQNSTIDFSLLENCLRQDLDVSAPRRLAVISPLKVVLENLPDDHNESLVFPNHPKNPDAGTRQLSFSNALWIERDDFALVPPKGWKRLIPSGEVRLRGVGIIRVDQVIQNTNGDVVELRCWLDPSSRSGLPGAERKVKGTIHWVNIRTAIPAQFRLFDRLFSEPDPDHESDNTTYRDRLNPHSFKLVHGYCEPAAALLPLEQSVQFERLGYFVADRRLFTPQAPVFNRSVALRDTWQGSGLVGTAQKK